MLKLEKTNHSYYCNESGYYSGKNLIYENWEEFYNEFNIENIDNDYNYVFRFDIIKNEDENGEEINNFSLMLYYMQQRKGKFISVEIKNIKEKNIEDINNYLKKCNSYIKELWKEFM